MRLVFLKEMLLCCRMEIEKLNIVCKSRSDARQTQNNAEKSEYTACRRKIPDFIYVPSKRQRL